MRTRQTPQRPAVPLEGSSARTTVLRKTLSLAGSLSLTAVAVVAATALLLPAALAPHREPQQAPPWTLVDDAGGSGSQTPDKGPSHPSGYPSGSPTTGPDHPTPGTVEDEERTGGSGGGTGTSFGLQVGMSIGLIAVFALFLIPGRRPPRSAGARTGR